MPKKLIQYIDNSREDIIFLQKNLVSIKALAPENGGDGEYLKANFLQNYIKNLDPDFSLIVKAPDNRTTNGYRPSLIYKWHGQKQQTLWILSHTDVVPTGDLALWETDPFTLKVDGDLLYGRGVEDNHQGLTSSLIVAKTINEIKAKTDISLGLILVADEETRSSHGIDYILKNHKNLFSKDDMFLIPDSGSNDGSAIEIAEKQLIWLKCSVTGAQCHASTPENGINSLIVSADLILQIANLEQVFSGQNALFTPPYSTITPTRKDSNVQNINTIPGFDVFYVDMRILPEYNIEEVLKTINELAISIGKKYKADIKIEIEQSQTSISTNESSSLVTKLKQTIKKMRNIEAKCVGIGGGTVAAFLRNAGFDAVVWATIFHTAHQPNEYSSITNTIKDAQVMIGLLFD